MAIRIRKTRKGSMAESNLGTYYIEDTKPQMQHLCVVSSGINTIEEAKEQAAYWRTRQQFDCLVEQLSDKAGTSILWLTVDGKLEHYFDKELVADVTDPMVRTMVVISAETMPSWIVCLLGKVHQHTDAQLHAEFTKAWEGREGYLQECPSGQQPEHVCVFLPH